MNRFLTIDLDVAIVIGVGARYLRLESLGKQNTGPQITDPAASFK